MGLEEEQLEVEEDALMQIIREYTRESGVRNLEQQVAAICRKAAKADRHLTLRSVRFKLIQPNLRNI